MTNIIFVLLVGLATLSYLVVGYLGLAAERDMERLADLNYWSNRFFEAANDVVAAKDVPSDPIDMIDFLNRKITDPKAAKNMAIALRRRHRGKQVREIDECEPELEAKITDVLMSGMLAISYTDRAWGVVAREALLRTLVEADKHPERVIQEFRFVRNDKREKQLMSGSDYGVAEAA